MRVFARLFAMQQCIDTTSAQDTFWQWATRWADTKRPGEANQALMELGALICRRTAPRCHQCPLEAACEARQRGMQDRLPVRKTRPAVVHVQLAALLLQQRGRILLAQRRDGQLLRGYWEMPTVLMDVDGAEAPPPSRSKASPPTINAWRRNSAASGSPGSRSR